MDHDGNLNHADTLQCVTTGPGGARTGHLTVSTAEELLFPANFISRVASPTH